MDPTLTAIVAVITFLIALYIIVDLFANTLINPATRTQMFVAVAGVPKELSFGITSVNSLALLTANNSVNTSLIPGNATLNINGEPAAAASLEVTHDAGEAGRSVFVNLHNVGTLTDAASDTFTISVSYLVNGGNAVSVG